MRYLIANIVIYDSKEGVLSTHHDPDREEKRLTPTANRILRLLIESYGRTVTREELLENVWESQGQTASNSSLNQYVSILRKTFSSFYDLDGIIVSVPRLGFIISDAISVEVLPTQLAPLPHSLTTHTEISQVRYNLLRRLLLKHRQWLAYVMLISALVIFFGVIHRAWFQRNDILYDNMVEFGHLDKCTFYSYTNLPSTIASRVIESLGGIDNRIYSKCKHRRAKIIFSAQRKVYYGEPGKVFISYCPLEDEDSVFYCANQYFYHRVMK